MERYDLAYLQLSDIPKDFVYGHRYCYEDAALKESVRAEGILLPIIVTSGAPHRIISGYRRFQAAREAALPHVPALVLREKLSDKDAYRLSLIAGWGQSRGELDRAETFRQALKLGFSKEEIQKEILPLIGLPSEIHWIHELELIASLTELLKEAIYQEKIPARGSSLLSRFSADDQKIFAVKIAETLHLTSSQLMKTAEWLLDLTRLSKEPLEMVLNRPELREILVLRTEDTRQKTDQFFKALRVLRFPRLSVCEKAFEKAAREIEQGEKDFKIEAPPYFEEPGFGLRLKVRDPESLERLIKNLGEKRSSMLELFKIVL